MKKIIIIVIIAIGMIFLYQKITTPRDFSKTLNKEQINAVNNNPLNSYAKIATGNMLTYENKECGFSFQYPDDWTVDAGTTERGCKNMELTVHSSALSNLKGFEGKPMQYKISIYYSSVGTTTIIGEFTGVRIDQVAFPVTYDKTQYKEYQDGQKIIEMFRASLSSARAAKVQYINRY